MDEPALLAAITDAPEDRVVRLVYADWLDDHGRPDEADWVRIEERMRELPIHGDDYWALKPRRNELRDEVGLERQTRMGYGRDYGSVFSEWPDGWKERWRLIREFVERAYGLAMADAGTWGYAVENAEHYFEITIPPSMREWITLTEWLDVERVNAHQGSAWPSRIIRERLTLLLYTDYGDLEDQGWLVRDADLGSSDPPVFTCLVSLNHLGYWSTNPLQLAADSLSLFAREELQRYRAALDSTGPPS